MVLRCVVVEFLLMRKLYRTSSVKKLGGSVCTHVLELDAVDLACAPRSASNATPGANLLSSICKNLAIKESQIVWACTCCETLVRVCIRTELIYYILSVLWSREELVCTILMTTGK